MIAGATVFPSDADRVPDEGRTAAPLHPALSCPAGVVLAGGRSRRFGRDKTALVMPDSDKNSHRQTLVLRAVAELQKLLGDKAPVFVSCRPPEEGDEDSLRMRAEATAQGAGIVEDRLPGEGPLQAVYSTLEQTRLSCLFIPCDLPCMDAATLAELLAFRNKTLQEKPDTLCSCFFDTVYGATQPLVAIYEAGGLPLFRQAYAEGRRKLSTVIPVEQTSCLYYGAEKAYYFQNVNVPADWENIRHQLLHHS